jgi:phthiocerol/phenolphthiocerol synthesis type-I polyketide synthase E
MGSHGTAQHRLVETCITIWQEVLGLKSVMPDEDFFEMGGDSLAATLISVKVQRATGIRVPVRTIWDNPTVAAFATALTGRAA